MKEVIDVNGHESIQKAEVEGSDSYFDLRKKKKRACNKEAISPSHAVISTSTDPLSNELLTAHLMLQAKDTGHQV